MALTCLNFRKMARSSTKASNNHVPSLDYDVVKSYVTCKFPEEAPRIFMPESRLEELITKETIIQEFSAPSVASRIRLLKRSNPLDNDLLDFILKSAKRVFMISIICNVRSGDLKQAMSEFKAKSFGDKDLPIRLDDSQDEHPHLNSSLWPLPKRMEFEQNQWRLLAPVFPPEYEEDLVLENEHILPFTYVGANKKEGTFGTVYEVSIHHSHQKEPMLKVR